jgi:DeoR family transcriptional regulator of aga operon
MSMSKPKVDRMLTEERRREILSLLAQAGRITVVEVVRQFGVSAVTARVDLDALAESGALVRSHGGAIKNVDVPEHPLRVREGMHKAEKMRIAEAARRLIKPLQTIILCTGSTSEELAAQVVRNPPQNVGVITYALNIATQLAEIPNLSLVLLGGFLRQPSNALVGPHAEQMMQMLHADHCFMSTVGLDADVGLTTLDIMEAQLNRLMIACATQVTVIADSSKFGHRSLSLIADFRSIQRVITDTGAPQAQVDKLRGLGVEVVLA